MLKPLFGSLSASKILLYLLVNEEGYAHQIQRSLGLSLTPVQKALARLEGGGILKSGFRGKIRVFALDPDYPLLSELSLLLKRAYHLLPQDEKKLFYDLPYDQKHGKRSVNALLKGIWEQLKGVSQVTLIARSRREQRGGFFRKGKGSVQVHERDGLLVFEEQGVWQQTQGVYQNRFRWSWDRPKGILSLEHLRFGEGNPVFLFDLCVAEGGLLKSLSPYLCGEDTYFGWLEKRDLFLHLHIRTLGPKKDEKIEYAYL